MVSPFSVKKILYGNQCVSYSPDLIAAANNPKGEGIFENLSNRLIDFCYEFFRPGLRCSYHRAASTTSASASGRMFSR